MRKPLNVRHFSVTIPKPLRSFPLHTEVAGTAPQDAFGRFRVLHQIGAGVLGPVFRGYDPEHDRQVTIKLFRLDLPPERVHQLVAALERLIAAELFHPVLAVPLATGMVEANAFLVHEYVAAESLDTAVRNYGPAPVADALRVAAELAGALDSAAVVNIVHGALHPRDVLLSPEETRVTGVGVARALEHVGATAPLRRPYTAPERMAAARWDRRADIFSLGALMHEMLWGRRITGIGQQAAEALVPLPGADMERLRGAFARALAENPAHRYETALEFAEALEQAFPDVELATRETAIGDRQSNNPRPGSDDASREHEHSTLLPLEQAHDDSSTAQFDATDKVRRPELPSELELRTAEAERFEDVESAPSVVPSIDTPPVRPASTFDARIHAPLPARSVEPQREAAPQFAMKRSRSSVAPLLLALLVGLGLGYAGGYSIGAHDRNNGVTGTSSNVPPVAVDPNRSAARQSDAANSVGAKPDARIAEAPPGTSDVPREGSANVLADAATPPSGAGNPPLSAAAPRSQDTADAPASKPAAKASERSRSLTVRSTPAGALVTVDGREYGRTPLTIRELATGTHRVRVTRDGYATQSRRVVLARSQPSRSIALTLPRLNAARVSTPVPESSSTIGRYTAALSIDSRPSGAKVFIDGRAAGVTPLSLSDFAAGEHAIRLEHSGYRGWSSSVRVVANERNRVTASLEK